MLLENYNRLVNNYNDLKNDNNNLSNKIENMSIVMNNLLEEMKSINRNNSSNEYQVTENIKRIIKDAYRRDLFVKEKYPQDVVIEKFTRQTLMNNFPDDERYSEREKWDVVWFTLRGPSLELFRIIRGNAVRRIKTTLFQKFKKLEAINNDASMNQILEWKNKKPTRDVLLLLNEIEEDEDRTYLEVITRLAFSHDKDNKIMTTESESSGGIVRIIKDLASGTVGGICQVLVGQRLQTQPTPKLGEQPRFTGMLDCVQKTKKNEGFRAFYKGTTTPLVGVGACVSIQFGALEFMKRFFNERNGYTGGLTSPQLYLAGAIAGIANSVVSGPVEHIRTRLQVQITSTTDIKPSSKAVSTKIYSGPIDCIRQIYSSYGMKGIYKGQTITMIREFQGYGAYFLVYEYLFQKAMSREQKKRSEIESWKSCLYGAAAGYGMWLSVYPVDVIKSKIQTDGFSGEERQYKGIIDCARKTFRKEGINGFFKGFGTCILRAGPVNASTFVAFEMAMRVFDKL
ncbi:3314_t:CDS:2 [Entrophospora sp. SA101]|nr:3314_t:CDS:2 [Entrophospora sp. SA101]